MFGRLRQIYVWHKSKGNTYFQRSGYRPDIGESTGCPSCSPDHGASVIYLTLSVSPLRMDSSAAPVIALDPIMGSLPICANQASRIPFRRRVIGHRTWGRGKTGSGWYLSSLFFHMPWYNLQARAPSPDALGREWVLCRDEGRILCVIGTACQYLETIYRAVEEHDEHQECLFRSAYRPQISAVGKERGAKLSAAARRPWEEAEVKDA